MALVVEVDPDACMGSGQCAFALPEVFELDDDGIAHVTDPALAPESDVVTAAKRCPARAITVQRDGVQLL